MPFVLSSTNHAVYNPPHMTLSKRATLNSIQSPLNEYTHCLTSNWKLVPPSLQKDPGGVAGLVVSPMQGVQFMPGAFGYVV